MSTTETPASDLVLTGLSNVGSQLFLVFTETLDGKTTNFKSPISRDQLRTLLPKIIVNDIKTIYLATSDNIPTIAIDPKTELATYALYSHDFEMISSATNKLTYIDKIIPDELKTKYCLIFGNKVFASADTLEEIEKISQQDGYKFIHFTLYKPTI